MEERAGLPMERGSAAAEIVGSGKTMMQVTTGFSTAVAVQKPRVLKQVIDRCVEEATIAGDDFYYAWTINDKGKAKLVEGPGIGLAEAAARNWGNCAVMVNVEERADVYIVTPTFVDLETGFNIQRPFRQVKAKDIGKKYDKDRAEDIVFQIGVSKATRNVIVNALPNYLTNKMMEAAKANVIANIKKMGIGPAKEKLLSWFKSRGIEVDRIEAKLDKKAAVWQEEDLALLYGAMTSLNKGQELPEELFPPLKPEPTTFNLPADLLESINTLCADLGINEAEKTMTLGKLKGDIAKATAYRDELLSKAAAKERSGGAEPEQKKSEKKTGLFEGDEQ